MPNERPAVAPSAARVAAICGLTGGSSKAGVTSGHPPELFYTAKEEPHPQVVDALGLRITNCAPCNPSL